MRYAKTLVLLCIVVSSAVIAWCTAEKYPGFAGFACVIFFIAIGAAIEQYRDDSRSNTTDFIRPKGH